jgi:hypothetical protein
MPKEIHRRCRKRAVNPALTPFTAKELLDAAIEKDPFIQPPRWRRQIYGGAPVLTNGDLCLSIGHDFPDGPWHLTLMAERTHTLRNGETDHIPMTEILWLIRESKPKLGPCPCCQDCPNCKCDHSSWPFNQ